MDSPIVSDSLVFSPRSAERIRLRVLYILTFAITAAGVLIFLRANFYQNTARNQGTVAQAWSLGLIPGMIFAIGLVPLTIGQRTWLIDGEGITTWGAFGRKTRLLWPEVERVLWRSEGASLKGAGRAITIGCDSWPSSLSRREWRAARARLDAVLSQDFDLDQPPCPMSIERMLMRKWRRPWLYFLFVGYAAMIFVPDALGSGRVPQFLFVVVWLMIPIAGLMRSVAVDVVRYHRVQRQSHPEYPWRLRSASIASGSGSS